LGRKVWIGGNVGWKGSSYYVLYEIWSLEGSYGGDVIAVLCMWGSEMWKGCHELVKRMCMQPHVIEPSYSTLEL